VDAGECIGSVAVRESGQIVRADVYCVTRGLLTILFIDRPDYYDRPFLYGDRNEDYPDNPARFAFLVRAALEWGARSLDPYTAIHAHDWQAGLTPLLLRDEYASAPPFRGVPVVFTIHNLAYQGLFDTTWADRLGLHPSVVTMDGIEYWGRISLLKAGVVFGDVITTVSPEYAREIQTPEAGFGFDGILRNRAEDLIGILNGIDYDQWDPARDPHLPMAYDASRLDGKASAKRAVLEAFGLATDAETMRRPLVAMISRLVDQKGFDLLADLGDELPRLDASFVLLGTGERRYEDFWRDLAAAHPERIGVRIGFDEAMAHLIEGGADIFLMPSHFEPCGLNQMYSLRYGTVPVVRATGGLADTVRPFDSSSGTGTGFTFHDYTPDALLATLRLAVGSYQDRLLWREMQRSGMHQDLSWDASARKYIEVYAAAAARAQAQV
jgi:starch synthase